jgi:hypothetical protein
MRRNAVFAFILVSLFTGALWANPPVEKDLVNKVVAVADPGNPANLIGWIFDKNDKVTAKILDSRQDQNKTIYYVQLAATDRRGQNLKGIAEVHYLTIAGKQYLVGIGSINLDITSEPRLDQQPAQKPPGK